MSNRSHLNILEPSSGPADTHLSGPLPPYLPLLLYFLDSRYECPVHVLHRLVPHPSLLLLLLICLVCELHHLRTGLALDVGETQLDLLDVVHRQVPRVTPEGKDQTG